MNGDSLGDRMKDYEACFDFKLPRRTIMVARLDGKTFHTMTKKWKCTKPFDPALYGAMCNTTTELCKFVSGTVLGYVQSDEISLIVRDDMAITTEPFLDKRIQKLCSILASKATVVFNEIFRRDDRFIIGTTRLAIPYEMAMFDCRIFLLPEYEVQNYMVWRQQDATRNSIQMLAQSLYSHKELIGKKSPELQELCFQKGQNWNNLDIWKKRGTCCIRVPEKKKTDDGREFTRNSWKIDLHIPVFTQDTTYVTQWIQNRKEEDEKV